MKAPRFEIIDHGIDTPSYFPGIGTSHTPFTHVVTGIGTNAKEAFLDAVESLYTMHDTQEVERLRLPTRPRGIRQTDRVKDEPAGAEWDEPGEYPQYYVSIRYTI